MWAGRPLSSSVGREQRRRWPCVSSQGEGRTFELRLSDPEPRGLDACLASAAYAELAEDGRDVAIDGLLSDDEGPGAQPLKDPRRGRRRLAWRFAATGIIADSFPSHCVDCQTAQIQRREQSGPIQRRPTQHQATQQLDRGRHAPFTRVETTLGSRSSCAKSSSSGFRFSHVSRGSRCQSKDNACSAVLRSLRPRNRHYVVTIMSMTYTQLAAAFGTTQYR